MTFDGTWTALASTVASPGGVITRAWYNSRGLPRFHEGVQRPVFRGCGPGHRIRLELHVGASHRGEVAWWRYDALWLQHRRDDTVGAGGAEFFRSELLLLLAKRFSWCRSLPVEQHPGYAKHDTVTYDTTLANSSRREGSEWLLELHRPRWPGSARDQPDAIQVGLGGTIPTEYDLANRVVHAVSWADTSGYSVGGVAGHIGPDSSSSPTHMTMRVSCFAWPAGLGRTPRRSTRWTTTSCMTKPAGRPASGPPPASTTPTRTIRQATWSSSPAC